MGRGPRVWAVPDFLPERARAGERVPFFYPYALLYQTAAGVFDRRVVAVGHGLVVLS